jgi:hypothetical protein
MSNEFNRNRRDANFETTLVIDGANGAAVNSASFDLDQAAGGDLEKVVLEVVVPAVAGNTSTSEALNFAIQDSADNSSFAAITNGPLSATVAGVATTGSAAITYRWRLSPSTRRYIRLAYTETGDGFTDADETVTFRLLF